MAFVEPPDISEGAWHVEKLCTNEQYDKFQDLFNWFLYLKAWENNRMHPWIDQHVLKLRPLLLFAENTPAGLDEKRK